MREPPEVEGVEHRWIDAGGVRFHVAEAGDGGGDAVLMLHGWPQHWLMWRDVIGPLADAGYRVLAPDLRGFGWSERPGSGYTTEGFARDQVALLDALGIESAHVLGHDWGGWTGFVLALEDPDRVRRMVICNVPHPWARPHLADLRGIWRSWYATAMASPAAGRRLVPWMARYVISHGHGGEGFDRSEQKTFMDQFDDARTAEATVALYRHYVGLFARAGRPESRRLIPPTRLLFGIEDAYVSATLISHPGDYEGRGEDFRVDPIEGIGHFIVNEDPALVTERALAHFGGAAEEEGA